MAQQKKTKTLITKRWLVNYLLFFIVICLTWVAIRFPVEDFEQSKNAITRIKAEDVSQIKLETANHVIQLQKEKNNWLIMRPLKWPANNIAVERLLGITRFETESRLPASQIDLSELGLKIPRAVMSLNQTDFAFGDTNNIGNRRYLQIKSMVYLLEDRHLPFINQGLTGILDRRLLPPSIEFTQLKLPGTLLTRNESGWLAKDKNDISIDAINHLIQQWRAKQATKITTYRNNKTPLKKMTVTLTEQNTIDYFVLAIKPEIVIARPDLGVQYHFPASLYYDLLALKADQ